MSIIDWKPRPRATGREAPSFRLVPAQSLAQRIVGPFPLGGGTLAAVRRKPSHSQIHTEEVGLVCREAAVFPRRLDWVLTPVSVSSVQFVLVALEVSR